MSKYLYYSALTLGCVAMMPLSAQADNYQTSVQCAYHHTAGDDAIMMYGMPGMAMWHDFFGNMSTDAVSTNDSLRQNPTTTCTDLADSSAYWAPSLRRPDGVEVRPAYQKTYYQTVNSTAHPLIPFPSGLELLAGNHAGTAPNPRISFLCNDGSGYSDNTDRTCLQPSSDTPIQFNIGVQFPNCWNGKDLKAKPVAPDYKPNAVYADDSGACPADYPKRIPTVNMNIAYIFPGITSLDLRKVQLSLDPIMKNGQRTEQWGTLYTAHGDFMNGWTPDAAKFMTERCMNNNYDCTSYMPFSYEDPLASTYVSNKDESDKNFGNLPELMVQGDTSNASENGNPEKITLLKYQIPAMPVNYSETETSLFKYQLHLYGGKTSSQGAQMIYLYPTSTDWDEKNVTWNSRPACDYNNYLALFLDETTQYRDIDVTSLVQQAQKKGQKQIGFCLSGDTQGRGDSYTFSSQKSHYPPQLMIVGVQPE